MNEKLTRLLYSLGLSQNYTGFYCIASAVEIAISQPQALTMVTKWLYPQIARQRGTNWKAVEPVSYTHLDVYKRQHKHSK